MTTKRSAFTLVELLVVIGIIAVLVSILLPSLGSARKRAVALKCAAHLRDLGNAFALYASEYRGYYPAPKLVPVNASNAYNLDGVDFTGTSASTSLYWHYFLARYVTGAKHGTTATTAEEAATARRSILWGCPSFDPYTLSTGVGGLNSYQTGYGMNIWPTFNPGYPTTSLPPLTEVAIVQSWNRATNAYTGIWPKQKLYQRDASRRILLSDSRFWSVESNPAPVDGTFPRQPHINNSQTYTSGIAGQTMVDVYRHGTYPKVVGTTFDSVGGKVQWNALYADGHVETHSDQKPAYEGLRMRYPN